MSYYNDLAFQLRLRQVPEPQIAETLREVRNLSEESGQDPQEQFGPASTYAEQFPKGEKRSRAMRIAIAILAATIAIEGFDLAQAVATDRALYVGPVRVFLIMLGIQIVTIVAAIVANHRLPEGFRSMKERHS